MRHIVLNICLSHSFSLKKERKKNLLYHFSGLKWGKGEEGKIVSIIPRHDSPIPSGSTQAALHSSCVSNLLRLPSQPPYQKRVQPPYSMSKNQRTVKLVQGPRSFSCPHTSAREDRNPCYWTHFTPHLTPQSPSIVFIWISQRGNLDDIFLFSLPLNAWMRQKLWKNSLQQRKGLKMRTDTVKYTFCTWVSLNLIPARKTLKWQP